MKLDGTVLGFDVGARRIGVAVGSAFGTVNQSFRYQGLTGHGGSVNGTCFNDTVDFCDSVNDITGTTSPHEGGDLNSRGGW